MNSSAKQRQRWFAWIVACLTALCGFALPYEFPPSRIAYGQSYVVGFDNRIAVLSIFALSVAVLWFALRRGVFAQPEQAVETGWLNPIPLLAVLAVVLAWVGSLIWLMQTALVQPHESSYFTGQMEKAFYQHRALYSQIEFAYGPVLFYPTLWLAHLLHGYYALDSSYYLTLLAHDILGEAMLYVILASLPLTRAMRLGMFCALSIYSLDPGLGINYTLFRFLVSFFCLTLLARISRPAAAAIWAFVSAILVLFTSQELGVAYCVGAAAFGIYSCVRRGRSFVSIMAAVAAAVFTAYLLAPPSLITGIARFSGGFHHTILFPSPDILLALTAIVWFAPMAVAREVRNRSSSAGLLVAFYVTSLIMIPANLNGSDSLHVLSNSLGFLLLAAVYLSGRVRAQPVWLGAVAFAYLFFLVQMCLDLKYEYASAFRCADSTHRLPALASRLSPRLKKMADAMEAHGCPAAIDAAALTGGEPFTIPFSYDTRVFESAVRSPLYEPSYFYGLINLSDAAAQESKIDEMRHAGWAFMPTQIQPDPVSPDVEDHLMPSIHLPERHRVYHDDLIVQEIEAHWSPVAQVSPSIGLYRRDP